MPPIVNKVRVKYKLINRNIFNEENKESNLKPDDLIKMNFSSLTIGGKIISISSKIAEICLSIPVCGTSGDKISLSKLYMKSKWYLIGWGEIISYEEVVL